jgi:hypothetical protein
MPVESPNQSGCWNSAREALAEIRAFPGELQTFFSGVFDQWGGVTDGWLVHELVEQQAQGRSEREALQGQIDRLAIVAAELAATVAEQRALAGLKNRDDGAI